ncbi:hypothetical protein [Herbaspirillum autotrophicum]|uniref:hypothetical protein n=1 Tax=Herbaspirillum autotrophicum TaxID=180195 RepID=UPI00067C08A4|nr:hypothetical protein [Herbaspirillum autotrophicum]
MRNLQLKQTLALIVLTVIYLTFELGFNARLLDVVGGASMDDVHNIEVFGRTLSGIAAALVVFQLMLRYRTRKNTGKPGWRMIGFCCLATVALVYVLIKLLVDGLVDTRDAQFRRMALNSTLLQRSLVEGRMTLAGLVDDDAIFSKPEGKAFLALFPFMALSVDRLEERIKDQKEELVRRSVRNAVGGAKGYYKAYEDARNKVHDKWLQYARIPAASDQGLRQQQDQAWIKYTRTLARRGWTPATVPANRRGAVVSNTRKQVPVPPNWDPSDEATFRDAVEQKYRRSMAASARSVTVAGDVIPPGLSYPAFVARAGVQRELRSALQLPSSATVLTAYGSVQAFEPLYDAFVVNRAAKELERYDANPRDFEAGGRYRTLGTDAARTAIVPPVALFFSLLGAIGHFSKLLYLIATAVLLWRSNAEGVLSRRSAWTATGVLVLAFTGVWTCLSLMHNPITRSELFGQMIGWMEASPGAGNAGGASAGKLVLSNIMHVVAVGQGYTYPFNEDIRNNVLQGFSYGYHPKK